MRQHRTTLIAVTVAGALVLGSGAWSALAWHGRPAEETAQAFFDARRDGDCERLLDLVSEASWSADGRLSQDEFLERCADVVEGYQPELYDVDVRSESDDHAVVRLEVAVDEDQQTGTGAPQSRVEGVVVRRNDAIPEDEPAVLAYADGHLVREDGEWKIELDRQAFGLGRSAEQTVWGYLEAFRSGDCEALLDHLSRDAWTHGGETDRAEFLARCSAAAEARPPPPDSPTYGDLPMLSTTPPIAMPKTIEMSHRADGTTARIPWPSGDRAETVSLVVEDLEWKLDSALDTFEFVELGTRLVDNPLGLTTFDYLAEPIYPDSGLDPTRPLDEYEGEDVVTHLREARFERGLVVGFSEQHRSVDLLLYEFAHAGGARAYAARLADRIVADATENAEVSPVRLRGGGTAIVTECAYTWRPQWSGDCGWANMAAAVAAHGHYAVAVEATDYGRPYATAERMRAQAIEALKAQLARR